MNTLPTFIWCLFYVTIFSDANGKSFSERSLQRQFSGLPMETSNNNEIQYHYGITYKGNYFQAVQFCHIHQMELLSIETVEENNFLFNSLSNFLGNEKYQFWTSGTFIPDGHWIWLSTGKPIVHSSWSESPTDKNKGCLEVKYNPENKAFDWEEADCYSNRRVICEARKF